VAGNPVFASIPDPFRTVRIHVEEIQIVYIPYVACGPGTTTYSYDSRDNLTSAALPGGLAASYTYDNVSRLSSWSVSKAGSNLSPEPAPETGWDSRKRRRSKPDWKRWTAPRRKHERTTPPIK